MAGRPKKTTTENTVVESVVKENNQNLENTFTNNNMATDNSVEIKLLKEENETLKLQLKQILEKLSQKEIGENPSSNNDENSVEYIEDYKDISPLKPIKVVSLSDGGVSLRTNQSGSGKTFRFDKFGHSVTITYSDLQDVIATNRSFIEDGTVYICDADVVRNNYLEDYYSKFLTVDKITNILSFSIHDIQDMVSNTTETIQEAIISLIVKKINSNEYVDMNKVEVIGKACKTPCDITSLALQKRIQ